MKAEEMTYDKNIDLPTSESPSKSMVISELSWSASDIAATFYRLGAAELFADRDGGVRPHRDTVEALSLWYEVNSSTYHSDV